MQVIREENFRPNKGPGTAASSLTSHSGCSESVVTGTETTHNICGEDEGGDEDEDEGGRWIVGCRAWAE